MSYCVLVRDQADSRFDKVKSRHRTKRAAQRAAPGGRRHISKVVRCAPHTKIGDQFPRGRQMKRKR